MTCSVTDTRQLSQQWSLGSPKTHSAIAEMPIALVPLVIQDVASDRDGYAQ